MFNIRDYKPFFNIGLSNPNLNTNRNPEEKNQPILIVILISKRKILEDYSHIVTCS